MSEGSGHLLDLVGLQNVSFLNVVVILELHAALITFAYFLGVVLFTLERFKLIFANNTAVTNDTNLAVTLNHAVKNAATGNNADMTDVERALNKSASKFFDLFDGFEHAFQRGADIFGELIDNVVTTNLDSFRFSERASAFVRNNVKPDDDRVGSVGKVNVRFRDATYRGLKNLDFDLRMFKLAKFLSIEPRTSARIMTLRVCCVFAELIRSKRLSRVT